MSLELVDHLLGHRDQLTPHRVLSEVLRLVDHAVLLVQQGVRLPLRVGELEHLSGRLVVEDGREVRLGPLDALPATTDLQDVVLEDHALELPSRRDVLVVLLHPGDAVEVAAPMEHLRELVLLLEALLPVLEVHPVALAPHPAVHVAVDPEHVHELVTDVVLDVHWSQGHWLAQLLHLHHDHPFYGLE